MKIEPIKQHNLNFKAEISSTKALDRAINYMSEHRMRPGQKDLTDHHYLWQKIGYAILNHPSKYGLFTTIEHNKKYTHVRGVIKSFSGRINGPDVEGKNYLTAVLRVWRDFLNPENKDIFNRIIGKAYEKDYQQWWDNFIAPYWKEIDKLYKENI